MVMATIPDKSPLTLPCGITLDYLLYLFVGSYSKTLKVSFNPKHFCVQIHRLNPSKFCLGSDSAGNSKSPLKKFERTWGLKRERQWSPLSILRTTPALLSLFSIVVILAHQQQTQHPFDLPNAAWYHKSLPTFADALALVRQQLWQVRLFHLSTGETDTVNVPRALFNCWSGLLCYAA